MTHTATIMFAPLHSLERHNDPTWNREGRTLYEPKAIRMLPGVTEIPLLVDHREDRQVGTVDMIYRLPWTDGDWMVASARIDERAGLAPPERHQGFVRVCPAGTRDVHQGRTHQGRVRP